MNRAAVATLVVAVSTVAHLTPAQSSGDKPLACIGTDTFFPRGDHWAMLPGQAITVHYQSGGPVQPTTMSLAADAANAAVQAAFVTWTAASCDGLGTPDLRITTGTPYANRDRGDSPSTGVYTNVVYWVTDQNAWAADAFTVALTTNLYNVETGFDVTADMEFNNIQYTWRTSDSGGATHGCDPSAANCYDVGTVALHEAGHFLGLNHVSCTDADMYPSGAGSHLLSGLSHHERAGVCALYPPRAASISASQAGEACRSTADCTQGLTCLRPSTAAATDTVGWCAKTCNSSNDCAIGWICDQVPSHTGNYCVPGVHLRGVDPLPAPASPDLCKACTASNDCMTSLCINDGSGTSMCTQKCGQSASDTCPDGFVCTPTNNGDNVCWPTSAQTCQTQGATLNEQCFAEASANDSTDGFQRACAAGLTCFGFATTPVTGSCLTACDVTGAGCADGETCCYSIDSAGNCVTRPSSGQTTGACFAIGMPGDSCIVANHAICEAGSSCFFLSHQTLAKCYRTCGAAACVSGESCITFSDSAGADAAVCCDAKTFDTSNPSTCTPKAGACRRDIGVVCNENADCTSGFCLKNAGTAVCSKSCDTAADCPGPGDDVNGDGNADGGSTCQVISGHNRCWFTTHAAAAPACSILATATPGPVATGETDDGCTATGAHGWTALLIGVWVLRRRARFNLRRTC